MLLNLCNDILNYSLLYSSYSLLTISMIKLYQWLFIHNKDQLIAELYPMLLHNIYHTKDKVIDINQFYFNLITSINNLSINNIKLYQNYLLEMLNNFQQISLPEEKWFIEPQQESIEHIKNKYQNYINDKLIKDILYQYITYYQQYINNSNKEEEDDVELICNLYENILKFYISLPISSIDPAIISSNLYHLEIDYLNRKKDQYLAYYNYDLILFGQIFHNIRYSLHDQQIQHIESYINQILKKQLIYRHHTNQVVLNNDDKEEVLKSIEIVKIEAPSPPQQQPPQQQQQSNIDYKNLYDLLYEFQSSFLIINKIEQAIQYIYQANNLIHSINSLLLQLDDLYLNLYPEIIKPCQIYLLKIRNLLYQCIEQKKKKKYQIITISINNE